MYTKNNVIGKCVTTGLIGYGVGVGATVISATLGVPKWATIGVGAIAAGLTGCVVGAIEPKIELSVKTEEEKPKKGIFGKNKD